MVAPPSLCAAALAQQALKAPTRCPTRICAACVARVATLTRGAAGLDGMCMLPHGQPRWHEEPKKSASSMVDCRLGSRRRWPRAVRFHFVVTRSYFFVLFITFSSDPFHSLKGTQTAEPMRAAMDLHVAQQLQ